MGEIAKWSILIAGMAVLVGSLVAILIYSPSDIVIDISTSVAGLLDIISPYVNSARGLVNYFILPSSVGLLTFWIYISIVGWIGIGLLKIMQGAYMWIFK